jgi:hypothetical protein
MTHATGPALRAALRGTLGALLVALLGTLAGVAQAVPVGATAPATGVLEIVTVPAVPGARFAVDGRTHRANQQGVVRVKVSSKGRHKIATVDNKISQQDRTLEFVRWYHGNHQKDYLHQLSGLTVKRNLRIKAAYRATYALEYSFVDQARNAVERQRVARVEFRGDHGQTVSGNGSGKVTLLGIQPVVSGGTLLGKKISYTVQRVDIDGSNVVQVNAQRFVPSRKSTLVVPVQLYTVHFSTSDMLFGSPAGQTLWLKYPDGHQVKVPLDANGKASVERLARGNYTVRVDAAGLAFERPFVLSRNQYVDLQHVSSLDIAVVMALLVALMVGLYLLRVRGRSVAVRSNRLRSARIWVAGGQR